MLKIRTFFKTYFVLHPLSDLRNGAIQKVMRFLT